MHTAMLTVQTLSSCISHCLNEVSKPSVRRKAAFDPLAGPISVLCRSVLLVACLWAAGCAHSVAPRHFPVPETDEHPGSGVILNESISVSQRPARMVRVMSIPRPDSEKNSEAISAGSENEASRAAEDASGMRSGEKEAFPREASNVPHGQDTSQASLYAPDLPPEENLLDQMDVYALSPHAARLALPRMVSREYVELARRGTVHLPAPEEWKRIIHKASRQYGLDPRLVEAVIRVESNFDTAAESPKGAQGPMQLMPETQAYLGVVDPFDAEANVTAGSDYLRRQLDRFGSLELALAAYNAGPGNVVRYGGIPPFPETQAYVARVLAFYRASPEPQPFPPSAK